MTIEEASRRIQELLGLTDADHRQALYNQAMLDLLHEHLRCMGNLQHQVTCLLGVLIANGLTTSDDWQKLLVLSQPAFDQAMADVLARKGEE